MHRPSSGVQVASFKQLHTSIHLTLTTMAGWAMIEILKVTTNLLLYPAYYASSYFWFRLGNSSSTRDTQNLLTTARRSSQYITASTMVKLPHANIPGIEENGGEELEDLSVFSSQIKEALETRLCEEVEVREIGNSSEEDADDLGEEGDVLSELRDGIDESGVTSSFTAQSHDHQHPQSEDSITSSSPYSSSTDSLSTPTTSLPPPLSSFPTESRPPSMILTLFTRRTIACLSSFELLPDEGEHGNIFREPTVKEMKLVEKSLGPDLRLVEKAIEDAIEAKGVDEELVVEMGHSYFETMYRSFANVSINSDGIDTSEFLDAVESLLAMFEQFASSAFTLVQGPIIEDIRRIKVRLASHPESTTLQLLVLQETGQRRKLATESLLWVVRGLKFLAMALRRNFVSETEEELSQSFTIAWNTEYSSYFNWVLRPLFKLLIKACPDRKTFYDRLGSPPSKVSKDLEIWLSAMEDQVTVLETFFKNDKHDVGF